MSQRKVLESRIEKARKVLGDFIKINGTCDCAACTVTKKAFSILNGD